MFLCLLASCAGFLVFLFLPSLEAASRNWQWKTRPLAVFDTPFHNLALIQNSDQLTFFANGSWLFSAPDRQSAENAVHLALLQHAHPSSVLLLGGGIAGMVEEILKYPTVENVDYVEIDPQIIHLAGFWLPESMTESLSNPRVHIHTGDAVSFVHKLAAAGTGTGTRALQDSFTRVTSPTYDVILLNAPEPVTAESNRFYTAEFFHCLAGLLRPRGILSFAASSSPDVLGPAQIRYLRSLHATLQGVFPAVLVYPGSSSRFFASQSFQDLVSEPAPLVSRMEELKLDLQYVREYHLFDDLNPLRMGYIRAILSQGPTPSPNKDFQPTCYFNGLLVWSAQLHHRVEAMLLAISEKDSMRFWMVLGTAALLLPGLFLSGSPKRTGAVIFNVVLVGAAQMSLEIVLLLGFQILEGYLYGQMALIVTCFMTGTALGTAVIAHWSHRVSPPARALLFAQILVALNLAATLSFLLALHALQSHLWTELPIALCFSLMALVSGGLGGAHFSLAARSSEKTQSHGRSASAGPALYAADLGGAALGAVLTTLFLFPVHGLTVTLLSFAILTAAGAGALLRQ